MLAFALAALFVERRGWPARRALTFGVVAGAFATLPDVDIAYALFAIDGITVVRAADPDAFWSAANRVHRSITHSAVVAAVAGPAFALWTTRSVENRRAVFARGLGVLVLAGLFGVAIAVSGSLGGIVMGAFVLGGVALALVVHHLTSLSARSVALAATFGLLVHPWGDLFTGEPPELLYPFTVTVFDGRIALAADPTLHLLGAFAVELATIWVAIFVFAHLTGRSIGRLSDPSVTLGAAYGVAPLLFVPPTLDVSYHFVFSILAVGVGCAALSWARTASRPLFGSPVRRAGASAGLSFVVIALAGVTVALAGYTAVYVAL